MPTAHFKRELRQDFTDDVTMDISQAVIAASVSVCQTGMVDAQQVENRRMKIMHMHSVLSHRRTNFIGTAPRHAAFDTSSRQP